MGKKIDLDLINHSEYWNTDLDKVIDFLPGLIREGTTKRELREKLLEVLIENKEFFEDPRLND